MSGNRVEELEARVRELQATVDGLTDELLETKERLRVIEEEVDPDLDPDIIEGQLPSGPETQTANGAKGSNGANGTSTPQDDQAPEEGAADGDKADEGEEGDTDSADDIIVA
ncbi:bZIP transcription factor [Salinirubellus sp. GCM10025818]|jgi:hypothetical protein|uniref:DUF7518 family protein n=1 Tax=Salinirubellus TaxID=2162630 RepID=UPI0030D11C8B